MNERTTNPTFGYATIKGEGMAANPDEFEWECNLANCAKCRNRYDNWKKRFDEEQAACRREVENK